MKNLVIVAGIALVMLVASTGHTGEEVGITTGQIVVIDLVMHSIVNMYSTNLLITDSYSNGGIAKEEALMAVQRNRNFLKVLTRYSMEIKRQSAREDKKTVEFLGRITEICTNLDLQLDAVEEYIEKNDKASVRQLDKYRESLEAMIESLMKSDLGD